MKIYLLLLTGLVFVFSDCKKKTSSSAPVGCQTPFNTFLAPANETNAVFNYTISAGITPSIKHPRGFYYKIINAGTGDSITESCTTVKVLYKGTLTNGQTFDQSTTAIQFTLNKLIEGWQTGIPLIRKGGKIKLVIPPSLGYGANGTSGIPGNSILVFDIDLVDYF
jgi:FKBP-type peptidyl-prolyl cis-trans isomerase FkpA